MLDFYFTYGKELTYPFQGGWTRVTAPCKNMAIEKFREVHPDRIPGVVNCASIYYASTSTAFLKHHGNYGAFEHEHLTY